MIKSDIITKIRGVFSGSLSFVFNNYSLRNVPLSEILLEAKDKGFTEPDPREDLNGLDVARKVTILAREVGLKFELEDIESENLIPEGLRKEKSYESFISRKNEMNDYFQSKKDALEENEVLRYTGEFNVLVNTLKVSLVAVDSSSPLGAIKNADAIFEIFTEGYGEQPIVVQGAGAGGEVTARGVYYDLIRIGKNN